MYTQIETVVVYEEGDLVECVRDFYLDKIRRGDVLRIDAIENIGGEQWLGFRLEEGVLTSVQARCFKMAKRLVKVEEFDNETKQLSFELK